MTDAHADHVCHHYETLSLGGEVRRQQGEQHCVECQEITEAKTFAAVIVIDLIVVLWVMSNEEAKSEFRGMIRRVISWCRLEHESQVTLWVKACHTIRCIYDRRKQISDQGAFKTQSLTPQSAQCLHVM